nr:hypothetical protein [Tanacetum cinerariifolium]
MRFFIRRTSNRQVKPQAKLGDSIYNINGGKNSKLKNNLKGIQNDKSMNVDCNDVNEYGMESRECMKGKGRTDKDEVVEESAGEVGKSDQNVATDNADNLDNVTNVQSVNTTDKVNSNNNDNCDVFDCNKVSKSGMNESIIKENVEINTFATAVWSGNSLGCLSNVGAARTFYDSMPRSLIVEILLRLQFPYFGAVFSHRN